MATAELLIEAATRNGVMLERLKSGEIKKIEPFLRQIDREVRLKLSGDSITEYSRSRLETMLVAIDSMIAKIHGDYSAQLILDLTDIAEYEAQFEATSLGQVMVNVTAAVPTIKVVQAAILTQPLSVKGADGGKLLEPFVADWLQAERGRITGAIRMGYAQGETNQQIITRIRGTKARNYADGLLAISKRNAEAVVRTGVQHVASVARAETWNANSDLVTGYRWVSTLDGRTSNQCKSLDGRVFNMGKGPLPPIHINCRSTTAPEIDARYAFLDESATRASKDGYVDADATYYSWLKGQPSSFQDVALGRDRAQLFRNGGLSAKRFAELNLDRNFLPLTLDEMRRLEPAAFERAGI